ncbi:hypothetical protein FNV43_RR01684 [Rhamnella rubrinervis]|uniref:Protein kinase domain-containing protein n=1 Tax=Rhamnella rubrinervis TaxID=2594499 RepID=A0A8K0MSI5_9ROSA|nr:hypothetical protein FNV43_RR01684 [Rhamnella rubrinervis]
MGDRREREVFSGIGMCAAFATPQPGCGSKNDTLPEHNLEELPSDLIGYTLEEVVFGHLEARYREELNKNYDIVDKGLQFLPYKYTRNSIQEGAIDIYDFPWHLDELYKNFFSSFYTLVFTSSPLLQGHKEWVTEVNVLGVVEHPNLVKLLDYCAEDDERGIQHLLIYEYMPNRSVLDHLSSQF